MPSPAVVHCPHHAAHRGLLEIAGGQLTPGPEIPDRIDAILAALPPTIDVIPPDPGEPGLAIAERLHHPNLIAFLRSAYDRWQLMGDAGGEPPDHWPYPSPLARPPRAAQTEAGVGCCDGQTPVLADTWPPAVAAADAAATAARLLADGAPRAAALCRPPGHHAGHAYYGGFCFLNNAAIAAQRLLDDGRSRVAILDVDYHHGNGTQDIFYERDDVLFVSLHADPDVEFPFHSGRAHERGEGPGKGATLNLPLPLGVDWPAYADALTTALDEIRRRNCDALVLSLGLDLHRGDPLGQFALDDGDVRRVAEAVDTLGLDTAVIFEGGYNVNDLGRLYADFLDALGF